MCMHIYDIRGSLVAQTVKNLLAMQETWVQSLGWEDPLQKGMATNFSILAWRTPWTEEPGGLQSMGSQRVWHDWVTNTFTFMCVIHIYPLHMYPIYTHIPATPYKCWQIWYVKNNTAVALSHLWISALNVQNKIFLFWKNICCWGHLDINQLIILEQSIGEHWKISVGGSVCLCGKGSRGSVGWQCGRGL